MLGSGTYGFAFRFEINNTETNKNILFCAKFSMYLHYNTCDKK